MWIPRPPLQDEQGNFVIVDFPRNMLVIFSMGDSGIIGGFWSPVDRRDEGVYFEARVRRGRREERGTVFVVPKRPDSLFVFQPDGTSRRLPLEPGQAERLYELVKRQTTDLYTPIMEAYGDRKNLGPGDPVR